jgi:predicted RNA-binding protein with RPS1 domain
MVKIMSETESYVQMLTDSLVMKKSVLEKIVALNEEQKAILTADEFDSEAFNTNAGNKALLVNEINRLDTGFESLFARVKEQLEANKSAYAAQIATLKSLIKDVTELAVRVEADEARNKTLAQKCFSGLRKDVRNARNNVQKTNTYYQNMNKIDTSPVFMDTKK